MTTACIVQARLGSSRFPGKILRHLAGRTVLAHVLRRCAAIPGVDVVVCATVEGEEGDIISAEALRAGAQTVQGPMNDVLERYHMAADSVAADVVMRVTSDCPLIDPGLCGRVLTPVTTGEAAYAANNMPPGFPHGLDAEAFTRAALDEAAAAATDAHDREHVTPWIRNNQALTRHNIAGPGGDLVQWRWTLDYQEDLAFLAALYALMPDEESIPDWQAAADILKAHPALHAINQHRRQR